MIIIVKQGALAQHLTRVNETKPKDAQMKEKTSESVICQNIIPETS